MNRDTLTGLIIGLLAGFILGYFIGSAHFFEGTASVPVAQAAAPAQPVAIPSAVNQLQLQQRVLSAEAALAADPKNVEGWVALGNDCFDLHLAQKAVDAYGKALALAPAMPVAPDILTDQGVMYRELKQYDQAISNFKQANKLNPKHLQSLYNMGIVYAQDKHDNPAALQAWNKILALDPTSPQANQARQSIENLKSGVAR